MFVRTSTRRNRDGTRVSYLQLAHNEWDPAAKTARTKVLYSFGRADQLDRAAIERLIAALTRLLGTEPRRRRGPDRARAVGVPGLVFTESRPLGGAWLLDGLWHRLGIDTLLRRLAGRHPAGPGGGAGAVRAGRQPGAGAVLEAGRDLLGRARRAPARPDRRRPVSDDACYRAMDWLLAVEADWPAGCSTRSRTCSTWKST